MGWARAALLSRGRQGSGRHVERTARNEMSLRKGLGRGCRLAGISRQQAGGPSFQWPLRTRLRLLASTELRERLGDDLAEEREVAVEFGVRSLVDGDLGRDELACLQVEGIGEGDKAGVTEEDRPVCRLDLLREALEGGEEGDRARLLVHERRRSADQSCG